MSFNPDNYPANWREISFRIRFERAAGRCECNGECGLHRTHPGPRRCVEMNGQPAVWAKGKVMLTVAHLCHDPGCADESHLRAMCNRCHLRYDVDHHKANARRKRADKAGQQWLGDLETVGVKEVPPASVAETGAVPAAAIFTL